MPMTGWHKLTPVYDTSLSDARFKLSGKWFVIGDAYLANNRLRPPHWHHAYELGFVQNGHGIIVMGQREYHFVPGQIYIINDLVPHMGYSSPEEDAVLATIHFHTSILDDGWVGNSKREAHLPFHADFGVDGPLIPLEDPITTPVRDLLNQIYNEGMVQNPAWEIIAGGLLLQALGLLARRVLPEQPVTDSKSDEQRNALRRIQPALEFLETHYDQSISLDDIAEAAHLSCSHCCALFKIGLGTTPIAYRNGRRLAEARNRLQKYPAMPISEIAYGIGFSSVQEFNRLFRRAYDLTPSQFRRCVAKSEYPFMIQEF